MGHPRSEIRHHLTDMSPSLFLKKPYDPSLRNHELEHQWSGYRSFSLTDDDGPDDYRVVFKRVGRSTCLFAEFGTHDQLYRP